MSGQGLLWRGGHGHEVMPGDRYGRLTVVEFADWERSGKQTRWICRCDCGAEKAIAARSFVHGFTKSCGCLRRQMAAGLARRINAARRAATR